MGRRLLLLLSLLLFAINSKLEFRELILYNCCIRIAVVVMVNLSRKLLIHKQVMLLQKPVRERELGLLQNIKIQYYALLLIDTLVDGFQ